jgi:hypothetical protein
MTEIARRPLNQLLREALRARGPLDDDQVGAALGITRQSARSVALRLLQEGLVRRLKPEGGKWITKLADAASPAMLAAVRSPDPPRRPTSQPPFTMASVPGAIAALQAFIGDEPLRLRVAQLEHMVEGVDQGGAASVLQRERVDEHLLRAALAIKQLAGEVNVVIHAVGILMTLQRVLEPGEQVLSTSLGAGTGGRSHDLVTSHRIAEFKFTTWRGSDSLRQRELFADFVNLAEAPGTTRRELYVAGAQRPRHFLATSRRALSSVCERRPDILARIRAAHGDTYQTVAEYTAACGRDVTIVDLEKSSRRTSQGKQVVR